MYYALVTSSEAVANGTHGLNDHFSAYVRQNCKVNDNATAGAVGYGAIAAYAQSLWDAFPDLSFETVSLTHNDQGLVSAEWLMKGTNTGPMMGLAPAGRSIALAGAAFARIDSGKILSLQGYLGRPFRIRHQRSGKQRKHHTSRCIQYRQFLCAQCRGGSHHPGGRPQDCDRHAIDAGLHKHGLSCLGSLPDDHHRLGNPGFYGTLNEAGRTSFYGQPLLYLGIRARRNDRSVGSRTPQSTSRPLSRL